MATAIDQQHLKPVSNQQQFTAYQQWHPPNSNNNDSSNGYTPPAATTTMPPSSRTPTNSQTSQTLPEATMAEEVPEVPAQKPIPAARGGRGGRGRARGGRAAPRGKARVTKASATAKAVTGRGRRQKVYDNPKAQAAHERMAELKASFNHLTRVMKPALNELADRNLAKLAANPHIHEEVPEVKEMHKFLDRRLRETIQGENARRRLATAHVEKLYAVNMALIREQSKKKLEEAETEMLDSLLAQLDKLEYLHDQGLPVDLPDTSYRYQNFTQVQVESQRAHVYYDHRGVHVPAFRQAIKYEPYLFPDEHVPKRKADGELESQPDAKRRAAADVDIPRRHAGGLLSAVEEVEERSASPAEEQPETRSRGKAANGKAAAQQTPEGDDGIAPDADNMFNGLPIPKGASAPDEFGVRLITNRRKLETANNRIMAPVCTPFEDWEIGFRDTANCLSRNATRARRGDFIGKPNSNAFFFDRRVGGVNSTLLTEEDFDQDLVRKHNIHPRLGIFMPDSVNVEESYVRKDVEEYKSTVSIGPNGQIIHSSRSVPAFRLDQEAERIEKKQRLKSALSTFIEQEDIPETEVVPDKEILREHRRVVLISRAIDPDTLPTPQERSLSPEQEPEPDSAQEPEPEDDLTEQQMLGADQLLLAAEQIESQDHARQMVSPTMPHKMSRPYDAIRDVFTDSSPPMPPPAEPARADTYALSFLAEVAEVEGQSMDMVAPPPVPQESVLDPRLFPQGIPPSDMGMAYVQPAPPPPPPEHIQAVDPYPTYGQIPPWANQAEPVPASEPLRSHDFLRTALNPQTPSPTYPPPYGPPPDYQGMGMGMGPTPLTQSRGSPYPNSGSQKGSLPALRPMRSLLDDESPGPEPEATSQRMVNTGVYYQPQAPPPPHRTYHNAYLSQEQQVPQYHQQQQLHPMMMAPPPQQGPPPPHHMGPVQPHLAPYPGPISPQDSMYPPPPPPPPPHHHHSLAPGPAPHTPTTHPYHPGPAPRQRQPSLTSTSSSAAGGKYRKLEPAPTPTTRSRAAAAPAPPPPAQPAPRPELRTVQFDYREGIKDYTPVEAPPSHGPSSIRGWSHQGLQGRKGKVVGGGGGAADDPS